MPRKLWQKGLEHGLSRIIKESLLGQLTGEQNDPWAIEETTEEPIEKESIKARLLPNQVAWYVGWHREAPLEQRFPMRGELYAGHGWFWRRVVWYLCYEDSQCCTDVGLSQLRVYGRWPYRFSLIAHSNRWTILVQMILKLINKTRYFWETNTVKTDKNY